MENTTKSRSYLKDVILFFSLAASVFYYLALFSYQATDPSVNSALYPPGPIANLAGAWGASISGAVIFYLGFGALFLPLPLLFLAFAHFKGKCSLRTVHTTLLTSFLLFLALIYFIFLWIPVITVDQIFDVSTVGVFGSWFWGAFYSKLGRIGAPLVSLGLILVSFLLWGLHRWFREKLLVLLPVKK